MDLDTIARELLRALRGKRSQTAFSRRLGYKSNVAYAWESGKRAPTAAEALRAAARVGVDVRAALRAFYRQEPHWLHAVDPATPAGVAALLRDLRGETPIQRIAHASGLSRFAVARVLSGASEPKFGDFLRLIDACVLRALDLCASLVDPALLPSARRPWARLEAQRKLADAQPYTQAVSRALEIADYQSLPAHVDGWIAARLRIDPAVERACLTALEAAGQIAWDGVRWHPSDVGAVDTRRDPEVGKRLKTWWAKVGLDRMGTDPDGLWSYNVFAVSEADLVKIRELHLAYFRALRAIVAESSPTERVVVANVQLFALDPG